jgi:hypothetical protein
MMGRWRGRFPAGTVGADGCVFRKQDIARMFAYAQADALKMMRSGFLARIPRKVLQRMRGAACGAFPWSPLPRMVIRPRHKGALAGQA